MNDTKQTEREAYYAGYQAGYENGKRNAVRHGFYDWHKETCSVCGYEMPHYAGDTYIEYKDILFCYHCGAKIIDEKKYKMLYHSAFPDGKESGDEQERAEENVP